ncbi:hypothetical protein QFZ60_001590 [Arthrobacter sp. B2I5]|uniref:hypothetical protein n=1 Tax=Arthrobacter sp. B2I5 TaxID=3042266 RepID=UPI00278997EA|nr:hypothetical protein [Arthrobacter sp. B2I5]MDQ0825417.1 hypothetical protein [Arthrobacter sp. B2I5]
MANAPQYIDQGLTNVANAYVNADTSFIANLLMPTVPVKTRTFLVPQINFNLQLPTNSLRTGGSLAKSVSYTTEFKPANPLLEHSLSDQVYADDYNQTDDPFKPESDAVENIMHKMQLIDEAEMAKTVTNTSIITNNRTLSGTAQWNDSASNPIADILTGIKARAFRQFNTIAMGYETFFAIATHPSVLDIYKYAVGGTVTSDQVLNLFRPYGITNLLIGDARYDTSVEGLAQTFAPIWGKDVVLAYVTPRPGLKEINGGYKFQLDGGRFVTREEKKNPLLTEVVAHDYYNYQILMPEAFYVIKNAVA